MIKNILFTISIIISANINAQENQSLSIEDSIMLLENELLYRKENLNITQLDSKSITNLYDVKKSMIFNTKFSSLPLKVIFDKDLNNINLSQSQIEYFNKNSRQNSFLPPNIIYLSVAHNKSFSYSFYQNDFYKEPLKSNTQQILLFHEMAHFFISENINIEDYYDSKQRSGYKFKTYVDESYADLFSIVFLKKIKNINKVDIEMFFNGLRLYREQYKHFLYVSRYSLKFFTSYYIENYEKLSLMDDKELATHIYDINKKILSYNYNNLLLTIDPELIKDKSIISITDFFNILSENNKEVLLDYDHIKDIFS